MKGNLHQISADTKIAEFDQITLTTSYIEKKIT